MKTALALILVLAAAVHAAPAQLVLRLHDSQGHTFTYRTAVDTGTYTDSPGAPELARQLTVAKSKMADELGYTAKLYGRDHYKLLGAVRVMGAWIEAGERRDALGWFRAEPAD